jgi:hypothetical protein
MAKEFVEHELYVLKEWESPDGRNVFKIRVVAFGAKPGMPLLEKRVYYHNEQNGELMPGKRQGIEYEDFEAIMVEAETIGQTLAKQLNYPG